MTDDQFNQFVEQAKEELAQKQAALQAKHGLSEWNAFLFDQPTGALYFKDATGKVRVTASVTPIGSWSIGKNTWLWCWANQSMLPELRSKSQRLQGLYDLTGFDIFKNSAFNADEEMAWEVSAMAVNHLGALGCYRAPGKLSHLFLAIDSMTASE